MRPKLNGLVTCTVDKYIEVPTYLVGVSRGFLSGTTFYKIWNYLAANRIFSGSRSKMLDELGILAL